MVTPPRTHRRFVPGRTGQTTPLGELEQAVMEVVWRRTGPASVGETQEALPPEQRVAYNTVKTTMERLADKGILSRTKDGRAYRYSAAVTRKELERRIVALALDRLVEQFPQAVASFFVAPDPGLSAEKLALLQDAVARRQDQGDA
jgi:predicted transcriptional regulator